MEREKANNPPILSAVNIFMISVVRETRCEQLAQVLSVCYVCTGHSRHFHQLFQD